MSENTQQEDRNIDIATPTGQVLDEPTDMVRRRARAALPSRATGVLWVVGWSVVIAGLAALVFLIRAGDTGITNWPLNMDLMNSDNGSLFQFAQDVFAGRSLDWSFSPQVFVVPEIPISLLAFAIGGGGVYFYFLWVAVINTVILSLSLTALIRTLAPGATWGTTSLRAAVASLPLLLFPLLGTAQLFYYAMMPVYYIGVYLTFLLAPVFLLARSRRIRLVLGIGLALTIASNPLALVFAVPGAVAVTLLRWREKGFRSLIRPGLAVAAVGVGALLVRVVLFTPLQGTSPTSYIDLEGFLTRFEGLGPGVGLQVSGNVTRAIIVVAWVAAFACLAGAIVGIIRSRRRPLDRGAVVLSAVFLGLVPLGGFVMTVVLLITRYLYLWPTLMSPFVLLLLLIPARWLRTAAIAGFAALLVVGVGTGAVGNLGRLSLYFDYRSDQTRCIDAALPVGVTVGYATFSDARKLSLSSGTPFRMIQIDGPALVPNYWLVNRATAHTIPGQFFYLNAGNPEAPISEKKVVAEFGTPDLSASCGAGTALLIYTDPAKQSLIADFYGVRR